MRHSDQSFQVFGKAVKALPKRMAGGGNVHGMIEYSKVCVLSTIKLQTFALLYGSFPNLADGLLPIRKINNSEDDSAVLRLTRVTTHLYKNNISYYISPFSKLKRFSKGPLKQCTVFHLDTIVFHFH